MFSSVNKGVLTYTSKYSSPQELGCQTLTTGAETTATQSGVERRLPSGSTRHQYTYERRTQQVGEDAHCLPTRKHGLTLESPRIALHEDGTALLFRHLLQKPHSRLGVFPAHVLEDSVCTSAVANHAVEVWRDTKYARG